MKQEKKRPKYNGWVVLIFVLSIFSATEWHFIGLVLLIIIYVGWVQYLQTMYDMKTK